MESIPKRGEECLRVFLSGLSRASIRNFWQTVRMPHLEIHTHVECINECANRYMIHAPSSHRASRTSTVAAGRPCAVGQSIPGEWFSVLLAVQVRGCDIFPHVCRYCRQICSPSPRMNSRYALCRSQMRRMEVVRVAALCPFS